MENERQGGKSISEKILEAISTYTKTYGYPPTIREVGDMVGIKSTSTVFGHLQRLESKGKISRAGEMPRTLRVLEVNPQRAKRVMQENKFEVIKALRMLSDHLDKRLRELNSVKLKNGETGYDIRTFAADYKCEDEGITLPARELIELMDLLKSIELQLEG